jgi:hypothetical protein
MLLFSRHVVAMSKTFVRFACMAVGGSVLFGAAPAAAQTSTDRVLAEALFREGRELMEHGKTSEACGKFGESYRLDRALGTLLNLALCHEREGKTATAWAEFSDAVSEAARAGDDREAFAGKHLSALSQELSRLRVVVAPASNALTGLDVRLDGQTLGRAAWSSPLPIDPGDHELVATADGKKPWKTTFVIAKGPGVIVVDVPALEDLPKSAPPAPERDPGQPQRLVGLGLGATGVVGLVLGSGFGWAALSEKDDRDANCAPAGCTTEGLAADDRARDRAAVSTVSFLAGGALVAAGLILYLTAPKTAGHVGRALLLGGGTF